jgi:hypothetical protein
VICVLSNLCEAFVQEICVRHLCSLRSEQFVRGINVICFLSNLCEAFVQFEFKKFV